MRCPLAKIEQRGFLERNGALPVTVIGIDKLDPVGQLTGLHGPKAGHISPEQAPPPGVPIIVIM